MIDKMTCLGLAVLVCLVTGCGKGKEKASSDSSRVDNGRVAIVDLDKVASAVGEQAKVKEAMEKDRKELADGIEALTQAALADLEKMKKGFGGSATAAQQKQLQARQAELEQALELRRTQAENLLRSRQNARIEAFRGQARPLAAQMARSRGFSVVVTPTPAGGLLWSDDAVDLTDTLIEKINALRESGQWGGRSATTRVSATPADTPGGNGG